jgi:hypothetical protein
MAPIITCKNPFDYRMLSLDYISGLGSLGALRDIEFDTVALDQRLKSIALDRGKMDKHIFATFLLDKAIALAIVKPLHPAFCQLSSPPFYIKILCQTPKKNGKNRNF